MSSSDLALSVRGLGKAYTIVHNDQREITLAETMLNRLKNPLHRPQKETFWALRDISFDVKKGEVVGIIGRNGAGKSTLLKVLSRITEPTQGEISLYGRIGSLLEVGTGFHPELTGRENIYLNGQILGMRRKEIERQFDAIVDFAGVEKFLDTPVKRYSSGMYVRLAFAVAANLQSEILIVDEVLAVGDSEFQKKCLGKMQDVASSGRTVLFVSHNMGVVRSICERGIVLKSGSISFDGEGAAAVDHYLALVTEASKQEVAERKDRRGRGEARFAAAHIQGISKEGPCAVSVGRAAEMIFHINHWLQDLNCQFTIYDAQGQGVTTFSTRIISEDDNIHPQIGSPCQVRWKTDEWMLFPGRYRVNAAIYSGGTLQDHLEGILTFDVEPGMVAGHAFSDPSPYGSVALAYRWNISPLEVSCAS